MLMALHSDPRYYRFMVPEANIFVVKMCALVWDQAPEACQGKQLSVCLALISELFDVRTQCSLIAETEKSVIQVLSKTFACYM